MYLHLSSLFVASVYPIFHSEFFALFLLLISLTLYVAVHCSFNCSLWVNLKLLEGWDISSLNGEGVLEIVIFRMVYKICPVYFNAETYTSNMLFVILSYGMKSKALQSLERIVELDKQGGLLWGWGNQDNISGAPQSWRSPVCIIWVSICLQFFFCFSSHNLGWGSYFKMPPNPLEPLNVESDFGFSW